jgi:hypothetical protein
MPGPASRAICRTTVAISACMAGQIRLIKPLADRTAARSSSVQATTLASGR